LPGRCAKDYTQAVLVVARHRDVHHLDAATGGCEGEGPEGAVARPGYQGVGFCAGGLGEGVSRARYEGLDFGRLWRVRTRCDRVPRSFALCSGLLVT
jgi:hypothetical protein